jgi:hypothetical protein
MNKLLWLLEDDTKLLITALVCLLTVYLFVTGYTKPAYLILFLDFLAIHLTYPNTQNQDT